jgi:uridine phosphorylase
VPAPTAHPFVEIIVRQSEGKYEIVERAERPKPEPEAEPVETEVAPPPRVPTLADRKAEALRAIKEARTRRQRQGVVYKGHRFAADPQTQNALMSTLMATEDQKNILVRWKDANNNYLELERMDLLTLLKMIRTMVQACYDNEYRLSRLVETAATEHQLVTVGNDGWPEQGYLVK